MPSDRKEYKKEWYQKNKERLKLQKKEYYQKNKEKRKAYNKAYDQTPAGIKSHRISDWKRYGVICDDWDNLYEIYINTKNCGNCNVELTEDKITTSTTRCLDHSHVTHEFRAVVCNDCNLRVLRG